MAALQNPRDLKRCRRGLRCAPVPNPSLSSCCDPFGWANQHGKDCRDRTFLPAWPGAGNSTREIVRAISAGFRPGLFRRLAALPSDRLGLPRWPAGMGRSDLFLSARRWWRGSWLATAGPPRQARPLQFHGQFSAAGIRSLAVLARQLAAGCWLLAAGCWLLAAGCWLPE
jgi:hypothetical protein